MNDAPAYCPQPVALPKFDEIPPGERVLFQALRLQNFQPGDAQGERLQPGIAELNLCLCVRAVTGKRQNGALPEAGVTNTRTNAELLVANRNRTGD